MHSRMRRLMQAVAVAATLATATAACDTTVPQRTTLSSGTTAGGTGTGSTVASGDGTDPGQQVADPAATDAAPGASDAAPSAGPAGDPGGAGGTSAAPVPGQVTASSAPVPGSTGTTRVTSPTTTTSKTTGKATGKASATAGTSARPSAAATTKATVAAATGPLNLGIVYTDNSSTSSQLGGQMSNTITQGSAVKALVKGINGSGGLDGRMLNPNYYPFVTSDNSYSTDATAACDQFTQDNHESIVLDTSFGTQGGFDSCLAKAGVLNIGSSEETDAASSAKASLHENAAVMNVDRLYGTVLNGMAQSGYLTKANQIGIIVEDCADNLAAYTNTLVPLIARLGLKAPVKADIDCTSGFGSAGAAATAISSAELNFHTKGVDRVMFVSLEEAVCLLLFATNASTQGFKPGYLLSSNAFIGVELASLPADQQPQVNGVGYDPTSDVTNPPAASAVEKRCLAYAQAGGLAPASAADYNYIYFECAPLLLLEAGMKASNASSDPQTLTNAINGLGTSFASPGITGNATAYSATRHDGPTMAQVFGYVPSCTCIHYSGNPIPAI